MAVACFVLGIAGVAFAFVDRFKKRKAKAARLAQK
jgi:cbb3-type cytochrome oxidase subunit 3